MTVFMFSFTNVTVFNGFAKSSNHSILPSPPEYCRLYHNIPLCKDRWFSRNKYHRTQQGLKPRPLTLAGNTLTQNAGALVPFSYGRARNGSLATVD